MARIWTSLAGVLLLAIVCGLINDVISVATQSRTHTRMLLPNPGSHRIHVMRSKWRQTITTPFPNDREPKAAQRGDQPPPYSTVSENGDYDDEDDQTYFELRGSPLTPTISSYQPEYRAYRPPAQEHACHKSSCSPATGNLLIGRENRLTASSTCGLRRPERFCIVSHLEEKKCFLCDTRPETRDDPQKNHRIGQIIYKAQPGTREHSWWQSENGRENVTVQLDLEAEFHLTHLIIVFATFRPAAMLIERSYDFGKSWHVYKYFAHNCAQSFPGIPLTTHNITDVVCDHRYSGVEPSKNGEVIFRVLPPNMNIENPYATHVQNMLKMTNLRINFTRLHNLGDTLLDDRLEIKEKYYYAISNMVVRGSCSCYGHASKCLPLEGVSSQMDMVHGRCECTHNTKGLNCEECENFYNELPWKPALGKQSNACKQCNCNNHANSCHFDAAVYEHSGRVSGGVCDNCQHNTQGQHCEQCIPFFYRDPLEDIQSPYVCRPCDCDTVGSLDDGVCDSITDKDNGIEAGACHCKPHVKGRRCDTCKDGFWNLNANNPDGCETCTCNILGTFNNSGCNMYTGECTCKRLVTGKDCNQCMSETYGLSDSQDGCTMCDCYPGGSLDNHCDTITGQCKCRPFMTGRRCDTPSQNYYIPSLEKIYEAESAECLDRGYGSKCANVTGEWAYDRREFTGTGYTRVSEGAQITIVADDIPNTMDYDIVLRYYIPRGGDWEDARITLVRPDAYDPDGPCANSHPNNEEDVEFRLPERVMTTVALPEVCLEKDKTYSFKIYLYQHHKNVNNPSAQIYIDSLTLIPRIEATPILSGSPPAEVRRREYERLGCNETYYRVNNELDSSDPCQDVFKQTSIIVFGSALSCDCNPTGSKTKACHDYGGSCQCKTNVIGRQCDRCAPGTYGFGPEGCKSCDCNQIGALDNECDLNTGQCKCQPNTYGRECDQCQPGFWNFTKCEQCNCNGHAQVCDAKTGECLECQDYTTGFNCDRCIEGFYGDPLLGSEVGCRACHCPNTIASGHSHADECVWRARNQDMVCYCQEGYTGARCDECANNYFGHPEKPGESCQQCECSGNIDPNRGGNCDKHTGQCLQCLYDTAGDHCEYCRDDFYGDALNQDCKQCECNLLGTNLTMNHCDRYTGQCPCLSNVEGTNCDKCIENHWKIASGEGCEQCGCDPIGSESDQCNPFDGQCHCRDGFGGRQCNQCRENFWGDPNVECHRCECDYYGSANEQCDRVTGQCSCNLGIGGYNCDKCARGFDGQAPNCFACGECFDNWDQILNGLQLETGRIIAQAKQIKTLGATGAYTKEFDAMETKLSNIRRLLDNTTVNAQDISDMYDDVQRLRDHLNASQGQLEDSEKELDSVYSGITLANVALDELRNRSEHIKSFSSDLKANATQLQEANIEGALKLTREAWAKAEDLQKLDDESNRVFAIAEKQCQRTEVLIVQKETDFNAQQRKNEEELDAYNVELQSLVDIIPELNEQMCDKRGDPCDSLCGGAGCDKCGGLSCEKGAMTMADRALSYVKDVEKNIKTKDGLAEDLIRSLAHAKQNSTEALRKSSRALQEAQSFLNATERLSYQGEELFTKLTKAYENDEASPEEIKRVAQETLDMQLELDPEEIKKLASLIDETVSQLEDVEIIIDKTRPDLEVVKRLEQKANEAKERAVQVLKQATLVNQALADADSAQIKASEAIEIAKNNIELAGSDLEKIGGQKGDAQMKATQTADKVKQLNAKLNEIQKTFQRNDVDATEIKNQADQLRDAANNAHEFSTQLRDSYRKANDSLTAKALSSETARERAQQLLQRASKITSDTSSKLKDLENMTDVYKSNSNDLQNLRSRLDDLNSKMDLHLESIRTNADQYRLCSG